MKHRTLQHLAQCLTRSVKHWRPKGVATDSGFHRSESAERVNGYENRCLIWNYALENGFMIVTKDDDFRQLSVLRGAPPKVLWLNLGNCDTVFIVQLLLRNVAVISEFVADTSTGLLILTRDS